MSFYDLLDRVYSRFNYVDIPVRFSWMCKEDVSNRLNIRDSDKARLLSCIITPAGSNQGSCDCCWAFHIAQVLSDRARIQQINNRSNGELIEQLSPMVLLRQSGRGCCSNTFENGLEIATTNNITTCSYDTYTAKNETCDSYTNKRKVIHTDKPKYAIRINFINELSPVGRPSKSTRIDIQRRLYAEGPLLCRITLFPDFHDLLLSSVPNPFSRTGGVYMHIDDENAHPQSVYPSFKGKVDNLKCEEGTCVTPLHGMSLVGWDFTSYIDVPRDTHILLELLAFDKNSQHGQWWIEKASKNGPTLEESTLRNMLNNFADAFPEYQNEARSRTIKTVTVHYWILRNSWGTSSSQKGLVHVAFSDKYRVNGYMRNVNSHLGIECRFWCHSSKVMCGGVLEPKGCVATLVKGT